MDDKEIEKLKKEYKQLKNSNNDDIPDENEFDKDNEPGKVDDWDDDDDTFDNYKKVNREVNTNDNLQEFTKVDNKENEITEIFLTDITSPELPEESYIKAPSIAFYLLGKMYYYGDYIGQDYSKAFRCYAKAAANGNLDARKELSFMYYYGEGVEKDYEKAFTIYIDSSSPCTRNIPEFKLLNSIFGKPAIETEDNQNLKRAVENNDIKEQINIGKYFYDKQRPQDYKKALEWYMKAAEQGNDNAQFMVCKLYCILQNYNNVLQLCMKPINQNTTYAKCFLGLLYENGWGVEKNLLTAKEWYEKAAADNDSFAQYTLGCLYSDKNELENDYKQATYWIEKAAENKYQPAINFLPIIKNYAIPIIVAIKDNSFEIVKELIESGININEKYKLGITPLMVAAEFNSFEVAKLLIANGADVNAKDEQGDSPIAFAAMYQSYEVAELLCNSGAKLDPEVDPNNPNDMFYYKHYNEVPQTTPLMYACIHNSLDIVKLLIQKGVDYSEKVCVRIQKGIVRKQISAFEFAIRNNSIDVVKFFLTTRLASPQDALSYSVIYDNADIAKIAIDHGAKTSGAFMNAVKSESVSVVKLLIEKGAYLGKTALKYALSHNYIYIAKLLIDAGAGSNLYNKHWRQNNIQLEFHPKDEDAFKRLFILTGEAHRSFYLNGMNEPITNVWNARSFSMSSNLKACIYASTHYRSFISKGLYKIKLEIPGCKKYDDYSLSQVNKEIKNIYQDIQQQKFDKVYYQIIKHQSTNFSTKDATQFMLNGTPTGGKGPTVYASVKAYVESHAGISFAELQAAFPDYLAKPGFGKMIRRVEDVPPNEWAGSRFKRQPILLSDGTRIVVTNQWKPDNMHTFIEGVKKLGIEIKAI